MMGLKHDLYLSRKPLMGFVAIGVAWSIYFAQMPVIKAQVGASDGEYGLTLLFASFGAIAAMWLAPAARRLMGGSAISFCMIIVGIGMAFAGASGALILLGLAMLLASMGSGVVDVLINARVAELEEESGRSLMSLNHAVYSFAYAGAAMLTGGLRTLGIEPTLVMLGLLVVLVFLALAGRDAAPSLDSAVADKPATGLPVALVLLAGFVFLAAFLTEAATEGWSALHLERTLGGTAAEGAMGPAILGLTMGFGRLMGHGAATFIKDTKLMTLATLVAASGVALVGVAPTVTVAHIGFAITGLGISVVVPLAMALLGRVVAPEVRLAAISRASVIGYGAFFFGPPLMGLVAEGLGLRTAFYVIAGLLIAVAFVLLPALARRTG